ncbi:hypothetical protein EDD75_0381 [Thermodesulfitimonas autotrophica]|uniref:Uncharacterized protein n=1 Tax=Thermodesulfitimonas autotrophica TaxID=1894989 RepID=A0A3N5AX43_9THEO|nr:hypothetical protein [Thermodesulfitimonas autotrophica]RPF49564.1 hypothetical protein EDD75_0381 [Thermodesulfitimonas autotrophica]
MDQKVLQALADPMVFGALVVRTADGGVALRPLGGEWGNDIREAVQEVAEKYPGCKVRLLEQKCGLRMYEEFFEGIIPRDRVLPYADYLPEAKAALEEIRQQVLDPHRKEFWRRFWEEKSETPGKSSSKDFPGR